MVTKGKKLHSPLLKGITKHCNDCRGRAYLHSTGEMTHLLEFGEEDDAYAWFIEYVCDVCHQLQGSWSADAHDIIRQVLKENGILPKD